MVTMHRIHTHTHKIDGELDREKYWDKSWCEQSKRQNNERMKKEGKNRKWISLSRLSSFNERETIADNSYLCRSINNNKKADIKTKLESYFKTSFVDMFSVNNFFSFDTIDRFFLALLVYVFQSKLFFFLELFFFLLEKKWINVLLCTHYSPWFGASNKSVSSVCFAENVISFRLFFGELCRFKHHRQRVDIGTGSRLSRRKTEVYLRCLVQYSPVHLRNFQFQQNLLADNHIPEKNMNRNTQFMWKNQQTKPFFFVLLSSLFFFSISIYII